MFSLLLCNGLTVANGYINNLFCDHRTGQFTPWCIIQYGMYVAACWWPGGWFNMNEDPVLTHWGRVTHICVGKLTNIGSGNRLLPGRRQPIIWTNAGILLIGPLGTNFSEILIEVYTFSFKKMHWKMAAILSQPQCVNRIGIPIIVWIPIYTCKVLPV